MCRKRLSSPRCRPELIDSAWVIIVPGQKCIKKNQLGKIKISNGKKTQNVIVRLKSHAPRYEVFNELRQERHVKIGANLTKRRGKILYDGVNITDELTKVNFVFCNGHGDLKIRLNEPFNGKYVFSFETMEDLGKLLIETDCSLE